MAYALSASSFRRSPAKHNSISSFWHSHSFVCVAAFFQVMRSHLFPQNQINTNLVWVTHTNNGYFSVDFICVTLPLTRLIELYVRIHEQRQATAMATMMADNGGSRVFGVFECVCCVGAAQRAAAWIYAWCSGGLSCCVYITISPDRLSVYLHQMHLHQMLNDQTEMLNEIHCSALQPLIVPLPPKPPPLPPATTATRIAHTHTRTSIQIV